MVSSSKEGYSHIIKGPGEVGGAGEGEGMGVGVGGLWELRGGDDCMYMGGHYLADVGLVCIGGLDGRGSLNI